MDDKLQYYRQPFTTVTAIILGFALNIAVSWVPRSFKTNYVAETLMAIGTFIHIPLYIVVIYRILNINHQKENVEAYHKKTLILFVIGLCIFYLIIVGIMAESYLVRRGTGAT